MKTVKHQDGKEDCQFYMLVSIFSHIQIFHSFASDEWIVHLLDNTECSYFVVFLCIQLIIHLDFKQIHCNM